MYPATGQIHCDTKNLDHVKALAFPRSPIRIGPVQLASESSSMMSRKSVAWEEMFSFL